jgi:hypothetical protein
MSKRLKLVVGLTTILPFLTSCASGLINADAVLKKIPWARLHKTGRRSSRYPLSLLILLRIGRQRHLLPFKRAPCSSGPPTREALAIAQQSSILKQITSRGRRKRV